MMQVHVADEWTFGAACERRQSVEKAVEVMGVQEVLVLG